MASKKAETMVFLSALKSAGEKVSNWDLWMDGQMDGNLVVYLVGYLAGKREFELGLMTAEKTAE